jgi:hypothetical protein
MDCLRLSSYELLRRYMPLLSSVRGSFGPQGRYTVGGKIFATGGDIVGSYNGFRYHIFNNSGTLTVTQASFTEPVEIILVGAGGNGNSGSSAGPGGGAGALYWRTNFTISAVGNYPIVIGQPGTTGGAVGAMDNINARGGNTTAFGIVAYGGGGAGASVATNYGAFGNFSATLLGDGGSGASFYNGTNLVHPIDGITYGIGRSVVAGLPYYYGNNSGDGDSGAGGGGGGAGGAGQTGVSSSVAGHGGVGLSFNWTGTTQWLAGGGGGGNGGAALGGIGGSGVGGNGGGATNPGTNAVSNTGSGGGGSGSGAPGFGSAGTVWIRYRE